MGKKNTLPGRREKLLDRLFAGKRAPKAGFFLLLLLYVIVNMFTMRTAGSAGTVLLLGHQVPLRSLTGAFSSIANLCIIFLVVFYRKPGVIAALTILLVHFPVLLYGLFVRHNYNNIAGFCTNVFTILAVLMLWKNNISIRNYQIRLRDQAATDRLTGLPNRFACSELMDDLIKRGEVFTVAVLRLNNLRRINNTMGQNAGAAVLGEVVARWKEIMDRHLTGTTDDITCQSEDEFAVIIRDYRSEEDIVKTLKCYETALKDKITVDGCDYFLTAIIGYACCPADANNGDTLITYAHSALDEVRHNKGGSTMRRFTPELQNAERLMETERKIRAAIDSGALIYYLQPQYDMSHRLIGFEALARIREADGSLMNPGEFIPVAEKLGMIDRIDYTVFKKSACFLGELIKKSHTDITLSVNISVRYLMKNNFLDEVRGILETCGVPAGQLEIEITESIMIDSMEKALECIGELKKMGFKIAIDDFGTGYSSLSYLNSFPSDLLKVEKGFIDQMNTSDASTQYVATIISIGHVMSHGVIAEGVETQEQLDTLRGIGCDYVQGFIWGRPMPPEAAEALVMRQPV